jgi:hypothetical protein
MFKLDLHNPIFDTTTAALILRRPNLYTGMHILGRNEEEEEEEKQEGEEEKADKDMKEEEDVMEDEKEKEDAH